MLSLLGRHFASLQGVRVTVLACRSAPTPTTCGDSRGPADPRPDLGGGPVRAYDPAAMEEARKLFRPAPSGSARASRRPSPIPSGAAGHPLGRVPRVPALLAGLDRLRTDRRPSSLDKESVARYEALASVRVTIGVPVYNGERYLRETFECISAQTSRTSRSSSRTTRPPTAPRRSAGFRGARSARTLRPEPRNVGMAANFEQLVQLARGDYFKLANADDRFVRA